MQNPSRLIFTSLVGLTICSNTNAESFMDDVRFVGGVSLGYSTFDFPAKLDHEIHFPSAEFVLATTKSKWQLSFNWSTSVHDGDISEEEDTGDASREDLDLTIGYQINPNWFVFTGYKDGETDMKFRPRAGGASTSESYAQDGFYLGTSYSWRFEKAGSLNVSVAYADLNATNKFRANTDEEEDEVLEFDDLTGKVTGDTSGFSYAITWTMPLSSNLLFQAKYKINDYKQDITHNGIKYNNIDESLERLSVGLAYVF